MSDCKLQILSENLNGKIFHCTTCNKFHIEYKNLSFVFSPSEYAHFRKYFLDLDPKHWEQINENCIYSRKIIVPIGHKNFTTLFQAEEIYELKSLFSYKDAYRRGFVSSQSIKEKLFPN